MEASPIMPHNSHNITTLSFVGRASAASASFDIITARHLTAEAQKLCIAAQGWVNLVQHRLFNGELMGDPAREIAARMADEIELAARNLRDTVAHLAFVIEGSK